MPPARVTKKRNIKLPLLLFCASGVSILLITAISLHASMSGRSLADRANFSLSHPPGANMRNATTSKASTFPWPSPPVLEFIHITKTGGTSIESQAAAAGIAWGACKFSRGKKCEHPFETITNITSSKHSSHDMIRLPNTFALKLEYFSCYNDTILPWHCPPKKFLSGVDFHLYTPPNIKTFAIVRHPYDRLISEYYWYNAKIQRMPMKEVNQPDLLRQWVKDALREVKEWGFSYDGHCIPMHVYTHDEIATELNGVNGTKIKSNNEQNGEVRRNDSKNRMQIVDHILKLENLTLELNELMAYYGLNFLFDQVRHDNFKNTQAQLTIHHLTKELLVEVNEWAELDFELFGYEKITPDEFVSMT